MKDHSKALERIALMYYLSESDLRYVMSVVQELEVYFGEERFNVLSAIQGLVWLRSE